MVSPLLRKIIPTLPNLLQGEGEGRETTEEALATVLK